MTIKVKFRQINEDYSQDYADFHDFGKESLSNPKHKWAVVYSSEDIEEITIEPEIDYHIIGVDPDKNKQSFVLRNMCLLRCFRKEDKAMITYGVSRSALAVEPTKRPVRNYINDKGQTITQYFDITAEANIVELTPGLYVTYDELPNELKPE